MIEMPRHSRVRPFMTYMKRNKKTKKVPQIRHPGQPYVPVRPSPWSTRGVNTIPYANSKAVSRTAESSTIVHVRQELYHRAATTKIQSSFVRLFLDAFSQK